MTTKAEQPKKGVLGRNRKAWCPFCQRSFPCSRNGRLNTHTDATLHPCPYSGRLGARCGPAGNILDQ
jgi:hypothetical protein